MPGVIDLDCGAYDVKAGSIGHGQCGYVFGCTISPVPEDLSSYLMMSARLGATIRLVFPEQPLLLERVEIERVDVVSVRIVGNVIDGATKRGLPS
ncbi:MAG TPA: hypothetical protein VFL84_09670 [Gammaproteobacteria bacterium]|nr:hypothetical protein [Gammaproteobacteria bacterium]